MNSSNPAQPRTLLTATVAALFDMARPRQIALGASGRPIGECHHRAKLSDSEVEDIRELRRQGHSYGRIARAYGVHRSTIYDIWMGRRRAHFVMGQRSASTPRMPVAPRDAAGQVN
jgi:hypothetical protein